MTNLLLVSPALIRFSAILNDGASIVGFPRTKNQKAVGIRDRHVNGDRDQRT